MESVIVDLEGKFWNGYGRWVSEYPDAHRNSYANCIRMARKLPRNKKPGDDGYRVFVVKGYGQHDEEYVEVLANTGDLGTPFYPSHDDRSKRCDYRRNCFKVFDWMGNEVNTGGKTFDTFDDGWEWIQTVHADDPSAWEEFSVLLCDAEGEPVEA